MTTYTWKINSLSVMNTPQVAPSEQNLNTPLV